jgi:hypothetical protein
MKAVVLREYGGPENLKCEDNVSEPQIRGHHRIRNLKYAKPSEPSTASRQERPCASPPDQNPAILRKIASALPSLLL